ncbi:MAG: AAA family ATPase [Verrucomicrobia bacterium]|nr:AAA family ATPase [Verrucomicrobiota bacterium]
MAHEVFQLATVARVLADHVELAEALGFPEVSALGDTERRWRPALQAKAKAILEDTGLSLALSLHRRRISVKPEIHEVEITLEPPKRSPAWQEPVLLRLAVVRWVEEGDLHQAFIPALGIVVFAPREALLEERIRAHVRLVLMGRRKKVGLCELARLARTRSLKVGTLELTARIPTPREIALREGNEQGESSILETLAEELPPHTVRTQPGKAAGPKAPSGKAKDAAAVPPQAFEMEAELEKLAEALAGSRRRSVLLVGPAGAGKTALVRELARRRGDFGFGHTPFWSTSGARLVTGPIGFGMWQERCRKLCREAARAHAILHLGNLGELLEVGKAQRGQQSVGGFLRPSIARGEVLAIAECTPEQLGAIERHDPHLPGAFVQIQVPERTAEQTQAILRRVFETAPGRIAEDKAAASGAALDQLQRLHSRYALYSANPGRPIRFLKNLLSGGSHDKALAEAEVTTAFSRETGLPQVLLDDRIPLDLEETRCWFSKRLIGQPEAVARVVDLLAAIKARLTRPRKPLASFLFIGPTGTGKTELAKALAEFLFGDAARLARFDLNQYNDPAALHRLIGGPLAGSAEGLLTARVREQPFSVLLLDEFEKAAPDFFDLLLQILGDGRLTDASGRVANFCNCVIVMTSNLGAQGFQRGPSGFRADGTTIPDAQEHFTAAVRKFLRPEIFNRLDAVVPFRPLPREVVLGIARRQLDLLGQRDGFRLRPVQLQILPEVAEHLARNGYDVRYGARPLKRAIERELLAPLAEALTGHSEGRPIIARVSVGQKKILVDVKPAQAADAQSAAADSARAATGKLAEAITAQRRLITRLKGCSATSELENQLAMGESLARRMGKTGWKNPEQQARLDRLPRLRECLGAIAALQERARQLETEALSAFYQPGPPESPFPTPEIGRLEAERQRLLREVFRLGMEEPNDIILAVYSEHRSTLLELASAYCGLARETGQVVALDYFLPPPGGRSKDSKAIRQKPEKPSQPLDSTPEKMIGLVMHLRGDLFLPRFRMEAGYHVVQDKEAERVCMVETALPPFAEYQPPDGIERQGALKSKGAPLRRRFNREMNSVEDSALGRRPWRGISFERCLAELVEEHLNKTIQAVTG